MTDKPEKTVRFELMKGTEAMTAIHECPIGYLPIGGVEKHLEHLPMGLDAIKAHLVCCKLAETLGGVVFPPHNYAAIHGMTPEQIIAYASGSGNIYTDQSAKDNLKDIIRQIAITGIKVLVLYSGHYPRQQEDMVREISRDFVDSSIVVIPFCESFILQGDHAGISETSFTLYLAPELVDMSRIDLKRWENDPRGPDKATADKGRRDVQTIIAYLRKEIEKAAGVLANEITVI